MAVRKTFDQVVALLVKFGWKLDHHWVLPLPGNWMICVVHGVSPRKQRKEQARAAK